jgi:hypothetical protein
MMSCLPRLVAFTLAAVAVVPAGSAQADAPQVSIAVDVAQNRHPISPLIYGVSYATSHDLADLNATLNRSGGDSTSLYNWRLNARNTAMDWYFESVACTSDIFDQHGDDFVALTKEAGGAPMLTIPIIGWVAKLAADGKPLASFSIGKYGLQQEADVNGFSEAGNGVTIDGVPISENDPNDSAMPDGPDDEKAWVEHLVDRWGGAAKGGVKYYAMDNEPSFWHSAHRDVHPIGAHAKEIADRVKAYAAAVKSADPAALVVAPEEWGWGGYLYSGFDQQYAASNGPDKRPDRTNETDGMDYVPWLLTQWKAAGHPVDVISVHFYPQGGEYHETSDDLSPRTQLMRNRSTRDLWDKAYKDPTWINSVVALIPRLRQWADTYYYPGTPIAITEYNWGAEKSMNGATAQADILGIFGREGLDMAARWASPPSGSPTYLAMKLYRNYDGRKSTFGDVSVSTAVPDPDSVSAFAAQRSGDSALTVVVINKQLDQAASVTLAVSHFADRGQVESYRLADGAITALAPRAYAKGTVDAVLPAQSVTLFVLRSKAD